jgi:hypothetical protein
MNLRSQGLDLRADVVDESAAVGDVDAVLGEAELPEPRREDAPPDPCSSLRRAKALLPNELFTIAEKRLQVPKGV